MTRKTWKRGDKVILAKASGLSPQGLSNILGRRARATPEQAILLEENAIALGYKIMKTDWIWSMETENPFFAPVEVQDAEA